MHRQVKEVPRQVRPVMVDDAATTETICTSIFILPRSLAWMVKPSDAAMERRPLTRNSRPMMMTAIHAGTVRGLNCTSVMNAAAISSLSATGSSSIPWW